MKAFHDKVLSMVADRHALWKINIIVDYFHQILFSSYLKRNSAVKQFIG